MGVLLAFYLGKCIGSWPNSKETISAVEKDSGLKIPSDGKVVFTISDNVFMHGRLGQYTAIRSMINRKNFFLQIIFQVNYQVIFRNNF